MRKKELILSMFLLLVMIRGVQINAQVTIGENKIPQNFSILELISTSTVNVGGLRLPQLTEADKLAIKTPLEANTDRLSEGLFIYNKDENRIEYWDGEKWVAPGECETLEVELPWQVPGASSSTVISTSADIYHTGSVGIGSSSGADPSAILNVTATDKGVLLPRVTLIKSDDVLTILDPTIGLLVYNTGDDSRFPFEGFMFWNGVEWRLLNTMTSKAAYATLICGMATLDPEQVIQGGVPIVPGTVLKIPYTVGNGGIYNSAILYSTEHPTSDVQASISSGSFENGSGYLAFQVSGTPTNAQVTPIGITFDLKPFYDANPSLDAITGCQTVTVGTEIKADIRSNATIDNLKLVNDAGVSAYATQLTTPDGKFSVRAVILNRDVYPSAQTFGTNSIYGMNLQIRNNTSGDLVIAGQFNWHWGGSGGNGVNNLGLQPGLWSGDNELNLIGSAIYWANFVSTSGPNVPAAPNTTNKNNGGRFVYWGNEGIYATGRPERRVYSWTINDGALTKTAYILTFSSSALKPDDYANAANCPNGICEGTKVFMMIDQITAP